VEVVVHVYCCMGLAHYQEEEEEVGDMRSRREVFFFNKN
jgi:hypothetical protein